MKRIKADHWNPSRRTRLGKAFLPAVFWTMAATLNVASTQPARGADALRWKFKPGEVLRYTMVQETSQGMKANGQDVKTSLNQTVNLHWSVKSVSGDVAELTQTVDRVRTKISSPSNSFEFDSQAGKDPEGPVAAMLTPMLRSLVGAEFAFKMTARGELSDIKVPQKLLDSLRQPGPAGAANGMLSEEGMKNLISQSSLTLAQGPLDKGNSWTQQAKLPLPMLGTMLMDKTYTFDGPVLDKAHLDRILLDTKVTLEPAADSNIAVRINSQKGTGEFLFDPSAGRVVSSRVNDKLQLTISVMGQELEQTTDTVTTMTLANDSGSR